MTAPTFATFVLLLTGSGVIHAQTPDSDVPDDPQSSASGQPGQPASSGPQSPQWSRLSIEDKLRYDARHFVDVDNFVYAGIGAALDQWRDRPSEWGQGGGAYGERYLSHIGQYAIQRSIMFPVQAVDHEDTRYFRSKRSSYGGRLGDAFLHTVWRHSDSGGMMPAYSEFLGDYGAAAVSRLWWPQRFRSGPDIFVAGSDTILIDAGINVLHEFAPDVRRWLHLGHSVH
jgi:hypothetical protein